MSKCKHRNIKMIETRTNIGIWYFTDGKLTHDGQENDDIDKMMDFECEDCEQHWRFNRYSDHTPKWARDFIARIEETVWS